jgi:phospholipid/cholesterol/gamma-HCH transport system substrate-binding protein
MRIHSWIVGLFLCLGLGFFTAILFLIGNRHDVFGKHVVFYSEFADVSGLPSGAEIRVAGLEAGEVKNIRIPSSPASKFRLALQVKASARGMIRTDSVVSIRTEGIVGDKYISIQEGTSKAAEAPDGATLLSKEPLDIGAVIEKGSALLSNVDRSVTDIRGRVDVALDTVTRTVNHVDGVITVVQPDIKKMVSNARQITSTVNDIVSDLNAGKGPAGLLLKDEATRRQLQATLSNVEQASLNLKDVSTRADQVVTDLQSRNLAANVQVTLDNVRALSKEVKEAVDRMLAPDNMGVDGATNIRETLSNLNRGTTNLAEDTEALKHEFFFRGFFKKRGFYDLEQLAPADYVKACEHDNACNSRTWLGAESLFDITGGSEELVEAGRRRIDAAVADSVDSLLNHVVVVEGYSATGTPDQQFVASRRRADLVRNYLESHFHLLHTEVGIVALRSKPPRGGGRTSWDGVAIVLFRAHAE